MGLNVRDVLSEYLQIGRCMGHSVGRAVAAASSLKDNHNGTCSGANAMLLRITWTMEFRNCRQIQYNLIEISHFMLSNNLYSFANAKINF